MKILLVCESASSRLSGGKVVHYLYKILKENGHDVRVVTTTAYDEQNNESGSNLKDVSRCTDSSKYHWRFAALINKYRVPRDFSEVIDMFQPQIVHFASFDHTKSANLYWYSKARGARVILQPWTMHFYCAQGFGFQAGQQCTKCISSGFGMAIVKQCSGISRSIRQLERSALRKMAISAGDIFLSSNDDLDKILRAYGVSPDRIARFPIPFDPTQFENLKPICEENDYFVYYGQTNDHKGTRLLVDLFAEMPDKQLRIYPMGEYSPHREIPKNVSIIDGKTWNNGLSDAIAGAKAVILPSLWNTSTEYALCEAMAFGKAIVAFSVGAHKHILSHLENALVVDPGNLSEFREAIYQLDADFDLRRKLSNAAKKRIIEINDHKILYNKLIVAYTSA
jgi:glycosyltransferase involved in cell wall biosynthesis